jgi:hypothetical protein
LEILVDVGAMGGGWPDQQRVSFLGERAEAQHCGSYALVFLVLVDDLDAMLEGAGGRRVADGREVAVHDGEVDEESGVKGDGIAARKS